MILSDLDGTLLGMDYSDRGVARFASQLVRGGVEIVPCTSKTLCETQFYLRRWRLVTPAVVESGGALWIPERHPLSAIARAGARHSSRTWQRRPDGWSASWGPAYARLEQAAARLAQHLPPEVALQYRWSVAELRAATGLSAAAARRALDRHHDLLIGLHPDRPRWRRLLAARARRLGLRLTFGGRLLHLTGPHDKGHAARRLLRLYRNAGGQPRTLALGDSPTDVSILRLADRAVIIPREPGGYDREVTTLVPWITKARKPAPEGWIEAVRDALAGAGCAPTG
ncbi:MAG TPA: hypothetical protein VGB99_01135 [Acidobacteriota bacterium]